MKKVIFALFFIFVNLNLISALQIELNENYSLGESFIAKVSGNFYTPLNITQVKFYRGNVETSFGFISIDKIEGNYYISTSVPPEKITGEYSFRIINAQYFIGNNFTNENVIKNFIIINKTAFVQVLPSLEILEEYLYNITLKNLNPTRIDVNYNVEGEPARIVSLDSGETKKINFQSIGGKEFKNIFYSYGGETYSSLVYVNLPLNGEPINWMINETDPEGNETEENETGKNWWEILFGSGEKNETEEENEILPNDTDSNYSIEENNSNNELRTCLELALSICDDGQKCEGTLVDGKDTQCCDGSCVPKSSDSSLWSTIGWIILGISALFLAWFFKFKFSRTRRTSSFTRR
ncbi:hypothetical protein COU58_00820 [Candidatus Pacearchaeota archaeon CG10_big_fil_rev_8_21_14_0_10_32_42]|nr:MAG: hypothetical protein COU58_00820 [Candidatus Pacearchaeota archaeon CG10_big_fil_rev_8_21_14_0_10_32_42]